MTSAMTAGCVFATRMNSSVVSPSMSLEASGSEGVSSRRTDARGLDKLRASEPASHASRASESCESCESSCEPCETEVRRKENPFFGES